MATKKQKTISAEEFDRRFDAGEDVSEFMDLDNVQRPGLETKRVNVDFPAWMVEQLDSEARRLGINRQAAIKKLLDDQLKLSHA